jgi:hypothetical protein
LAFQISKRLSNDPLARYFPSGLNATEYTYGVWELGCSRLRGEAWWPGFGIWGIGCYQG